MHTKNRNSSGCRPASSLLPTPFGSGCFYSHKWSGTMEGTHSLDRIASEELAVLGTTEDQPGSSPTEF